MNSIENSGCGPHWAALANHCADWKVITALAVGIITLCAGVVLLCLASYNMLPAAVHVMGAKIGGAALIGIGALISGGTSLYGCFVGNAAVVEDQINKPSAILPFDDELWLKAEFHDLVDKKFRDEVLSSNNYSPDEKRKFGRAAEKAYMDNGRVVCEEDLVTSTVTIDYLNDLAMSQTHFSTIPSRMGEFKDKHFERDVEEVVGSLPLDITEGPRIYGHALSVNDNHQTGFIIDMDHHTVEYFNSFGGDRTVEKDLKALAQALGKKYGVAFQYHHRTAKVGLQSNGYDCGIWTPKLIEERVKQGIDFDPATLKKFDIASYRDEVYAKVHRLYFFRDVGEARYESLLMQNADPTVAHEEQVREYHAFSDKIDDQLVTQGHFKMNENQKMSKWFFAIYAEWGKGAETEMPAVLREAVEKAKGLL